MTLRSQREFIKTQLIEMDRLGALVADHPLMSVAYRAKREELEGQLAELPLGGKEARTVLFFSGEPVVGSVGIDANFAGRVITPFQDMVMADYASRWHGRLGSRGRRSGEAESRLLLTGLPHGSVGLELSKAENDEFYEEDQLADTLAFVSRMVSSAATSDEDFASTLDDTAPRVLQNLRSFLEVVSKGNANLRMETGDARFELNAQQAKQAYDRVSGTITNESDVQLRGVFRGATLDSWRFDFTDAEGLRLSGQLGDDVGPEEAEELLQKYFNKQCVARLHKSTVVFKNGRVRTSYKLLSLT